MTAHVRILCISFHPIDIQQVAQEGNNRSPDEQLAQGINTKRNSKRPLVELLKLLELELKSKPVSAYKNAL